MESVVERAIKFADKYKQEEVELRGLSDSYDYQRIYNAQVCAYEKGATEQKAIDEEHFPDLRKMIIVKACKWLKPRLQPYELEKFKRFMEGIEMDKCRMGDWECPYFEETHGGCCIPEKCPEYRFYKMNEEIEAFKEE